MEAGTSRGRLAPTRVVVERPILHLVRDAGGTITARVGADDTGAPDLGPQLLQELAAPRQSEAMLGLLRRLSMRGATVIVDDQTTGRSWRAERVDVAIERGAKGISGDFSLAVPIGTRMPEVHASYRYLAERQLLDLEISIDAVEPADRQLVERGGRGRQAQQALRRHHDERLAHAPQHLEAQQVEHLRGRRRLADLDVVLGARLEIALEPRARVLGAVAFVSVREQQRQA